MGTVVRIPFEVTGQEPQPLSLGDAGPVQFGRVRLRKTFSGPLTGTGDVAMTSTAVENEPAGYVAVELVTGTLEGRTGTFVLQHAGVVDGAHGTSSGVVLPGTGTGDLAGIRGTVTYDHDETSSILTLDYEM